MWSKHINDQDDKYSFSKDGYEETIIIIYKFYVICNARINLYQANIPIPQPLKHQETQYPVVIEMKRGFLFFEMDENLFIKCELKVFRAQMRLKFNNSKNGL